MARYVVSALKAVRTPAGLELDRIVGPGWMATPSSLLDLLRDGHHDFQLEGGTHRLDARRDARGAWRIVVLDDAGNEVPANRLPHWQMEEPRKVERKQRSWWQRLVDPDAA